jgi:hypothetical protein
MSDERVDQDRGMEDPIQLPRRRGVMQRLLRWIRRLITMSDDPEALIAFFRMLR